MDRFARGDAEVIVVGAGPAGAATAIHLARKGRRVLLLEGRDFSRPRPADMRSGEVLSPGAQQEIQHLGLPSEKANWRLIPFDTLRNSWPNGRVTLDRLPGGFSFWQTDRGLFDRSMFKLAKEAGVLALDNCRVSNVLRNSKGAVCGVLTRGGDTVPQEFKAPLVVDASGRRSALLARLKLKEPELEFRRVALVCFYGEFEGCTPGIWEQHFLGKHNTVIKGTIMREGLYRFSFETDLKYRNEFARRKGKQPPQDMLLAMLQELNPALYRRFKLAKPLPYSVAYAPIGFRVARIIENGLLLVGDTAGYLDPSTGQGIEFALRTARLATRAIELGLASGNLGPEQFKPYLKDRQQEIQKAVNWLRFYLRMSRQAPLLSFFSHFGPARKILMRSLVTPGPVTA